MPLMVTEYDAGTGYANPFVGPCDQVAQIKIDLSDLNGDEVDTNGYLKPGVPFNRNGEMIGLEASAGTAVGAAVAGNTGNGTMGTVTVSAGAKEGVYLLTITTAASNAGTFVVEDPDGITVGVGTVAVAFSKGGLAFTLADGATDFVVGDQFTITVTTTAGENEDDRLFGMTFEAQRLPVVTPTTTTTLNSETGDCFVTVCTHGLANRDIIEDNLGRALTAAELAAFEAAGSHIKLTST